jgi:Flp pilus assembly protein TadG
MVLSRRRCDERGAIAIMMAASVVMLCICSALVVDFGMAYVNKRQAQTAADAGALAAAKVYKEAKATCTTTGVSGGDYAAALDEAEALRVANMPNSDPGQLTVTCDSDGVLEVNYDVQADSPLGLGSLVTGTDHTTVGRSAAVKYGFAQEAVGNLRPWMICGAQVPAGPPFAAEVVPIGFPKNGHQPPTGCTPNKPGSWWKTECVDGGGSHNDAEQAVLVGCDQVTIAPSTPGNPNPSTELIKDCNPSYDGVNYPPNKNKYIETSYCLADDTGRDVKGLADEWDTLLGKTIAMPVFCDKAPAGAPQCNPSTVASDTKATWPVWKIAAVTICGYAMKGVYSSSTLPTGDCNNLNTYGLAPTNFDKADIGFLVIFKGLLSSGDTGGFPTQVDSTLRLVE